jgi:hypothetical protein
VQKGDKVKIVKGIYKNKTVILKRPDKGNDGWFALDGTELIFIENKEIGGNPGGIKKREVL